jgi:hypothetical protein
MSLSLKTSCTNNGAQLIQKLYLIVILNVERMHTYEILFNL